MRLVVLESRYAGDVERTLATAFASPVNVYPVKTGKIEVEAALCSNTNPASVTATTGVMTVTTGSSEVSDTASENAAREENAQYATLIVDMLKDEPRPSRGAIDRTVAVIYEWRPGVGYVKKG